MLGLAVGVLRSLDARGGWCGVREEGGEKETPGVDAFTQRQSMHDQHNRDRLATGTALNIFLEVCIHGVFSLLEGTSPGKVYTATRVS